MSDRFRVVAWDAPGAGASSDPPETFTTADYARCLAAFLDTTGRLVLADICLGDAAEPPDALVGKFLPGLFTDAAPQALREEMAAIVSRFHPIGFRLMSLSSAEMDTSGLLSTIGVPTLVLWGEDGRRSPVHVAEQIHAAIPGAELALIPGAGHVSNMEQPDAFNAHVRRFYLEGAGA